MEMDHRRVSRVKIKALQVAPASASVDAVPAPAVEGLGKLASVEKHTPAARSRAKAPAKGRRESHAKPNRDAASDTDRGSGHEQ